jgi:hypothetical protein
MPNPTTHLSIMKELIQERPTLFKDINIKYFLSGSVFPDIGYFIPNKKKQFSIYLHRGINSTITFAKHLLKIARTKKEKSFALGFMSHAIIDYEVHDKLDKLKLYAINHIIAEYFLDAEFKKDLSFIFCKTSNRVIKQTLIKEKKEPLSKIASFNWFNRLYYQLSQILTKRLALNRYNSKKKLVKNFITDYLVKKGFKKPLFEFENDIKKMMSPNYAIRKKSIKILLKACEKGKKEFVKIMQKNI